MVAVLLSAILLFSAQPSGLIRSDNHLSNGLISSSVSLFTIFDSSMNKVSLNSGTKGLATWYCLRGVSACHKGYGNGMYAAAGPSLRHGNWRGSKVKVCTSSRCVTVTLIDWCACGGGRVIDLYSDAFRKLAPLSKGVLNVTVSGAQKKDPSPSPVPSTPPEVCALRNQLLDGVLNPLDPREDSRGDQGDDQEDCLPVSGQVLGERLHRSYSGLHDEILFMLTVKMGF